MIDYVRIMPEIMANPIWDKNGIMMSWQDFNCPDDHLVNQLVIWNYFTNELIEGTVKDSHITLESCESRGMQLAKYVKHYFPDAAVWYQFETEQILVEESEPMWKRVNLESMGKFK